MIDSFYKNFEMNDYIDKEKTKCKIDCSLGINPFINNSYNSDCYIRLKKELLKIYNYMKIDEENISFSSGSMGAIRNLFEFLVNDKTFVLGVQPQFTRIVSEIKLKKGKYVPYCLKNNYKFNVEEFCNLIDENINLIYLDNPNNPTGQIIPISEIREIVKKANKKNVIVIIDEAYGDYMDNSDSAINLVHEYNNLVVIRSASKYYGLPNLRIGYIISNKELIDIYNEISIPFPFSNIDADYFINVLKRRQEIEYTRDKVIEVKKEILSNIDDYLYTSIQTPIFVMHKEGINLAETLLKKGVLVEKGTNFQNLDNSYARIRINKDYKELINILKTI